MLIAINHHYIREKYDLPFPGINGITALDFRNKLIELSKHGDFVSAQQIEDAVNSENVLPPRSIIITFDDGLKEQFEMALPVLNKLGIPALFFINTINLNGKVSNVHKIHLLRSYLSAPDFANELNVFISSENLDQINMEEAAKAGINHYIYDDPVAAKVKYVLNFMLPAEKLHVFTELLFPKYFDEKKVAAELYMNESQVADLASRGYLGSHGHEHLPLAQLSSKDSIFQIQHSQDVLKKLTGKTVAAFSFPYGSPESFNGLAKTLEDSQFKFAFTMNRVANMDLSDPFYLGRFDNNDMPLGKASKFPAGVNIFDHLSTLSHAG